jgi:transposase
LKKINENIDFSFVDELLQDNYCKYYGRPAKEPELLFRLLFLQTLYKLSDVRIIEEAQVNLAYKWFLGLNPEEELPDPSLLSKFRKHRVGTNTLEVVHHHIVQQAIDKGLIKSSVLIIDATHTYARTKKDSPLDVLIKAGKKLRKAVYHQRAELAHAFPPKPETVKDQVEGTRKQLRYLADLGDVIEKQVQSTDYPILKELKNIKQIISEEAFLAFKGVQSVIDPDARLGWKSEEKSFFGYKSHLAMSEERIITAVEVTSGEKADGQYLPLLVEKTQQEGITVNEVLADAAYSGKDNLTFMHKEEIIPTIPLHPSVLHGNRNTEFEYIKDADGVRCPAGHMNLNKTRRKEKETRKNQKTTYYFDTNLCQNCHLREGCYKPGAKLKTYSIRIISKTHQKAIEYQKTESFAERRKLRNQIESKNAEMKQAHGMEKAKYVGLLGMKTQTFLTTIVVNVKRMIRLIEIESA